MVSDRTPATPLSDSTGTGRTLSEDQPDDSTGERDERETRSRFGRRSVLKLLGASAIPFVAGTASATSTGYGEGGYGSTVYGGEDDADDAGESEETKETSLENTILVDGIGTYDETRYEFSVSGSVEKSTYEGASIDDEDEIDDGHVAGSVGGWRDAYRFSGDIEALTLDGQARVYVNGNRIDPADYGGEHSHALTIVGNGVPSRYEVTVSGSIDVVEGADASVVSDRSAEGTIERDVHRYQFSGDLVDFTFLEGGTQVYLDDQRINPDDYSSDTELLPHAIVIDGSEASDRSTYTFTVDGDVEASTYRNATIDDTDVIDGTTVRGDVASGSVDAYRFDGEISDFQLVGEADVDLEYDVQT